MDTKQWQTYLQTTGRYHGAIDGLWGRLSDAATLIAITDGPDTALTGADFVEAGVRMGVQPAAIQAFWSVEAAGAGFLQGRPKILPERHRFSRATGGRFDRVRPDLSNPNWVKSWYPGSQDARYDVLLAWCRLLSLHKMDIDAAFASCSWGAPQIMGENAVRCGWANAPTFAVAMARDEPMQLIAFERFVRAAGILPYLRVVNTTPKSWEPVAERYNGTSHALNNYAPRMAKAHRAYGGR